MQIVGKLKIHKSTLVFKITVVKLIEKHPKLMKSSVTTLRTLNKYAKKIQMSLNK